MFHKFENNDPFVPSHLLALKQEIAAQGVIAAGLRLLALTFKTFDPNQARVPPSNPGGGQWTDGGGLSGGTIKPANDRPRRRLAQATPNRRYRVNLPKHEARGGHTISQHVNKTPEFLTRRLHTERYRAGFFSVYRRQVGSFSSMEAAEQLINSTLARNSSMVIRVANGLEPDAYVTARFNSKTGIEAVNLTRRGKIVIRDTFSVGVVVVHDPNSTTGFRIHTAFPRNDSR